MLPFSSFMKVSYESFSKGDELGISQGIEMSRELQESGRRYHGNTSDMKASFRGQQRLVSSKEIW